MTSTMATGGRSTVSPEMYSLAETFGLGNDLANRLGYQPTSSSETLLQYLRSLFVGQCFDPQILQPRVPSVENYANQIFRTYSGQRTVTPTVTQTREFPQAVVLLTSLEERVESTAELLTRIRANLSLNTSELARTLRVSRQAIYGWMRDSSILQSDNRDRLGSLARLARFWAEQCSEPVGKWRYAPVEENLALVDVLSTSPLDEKSAQRVLAALAERVKATPLSEVTRSAQVIRERAHERGWQPVDEETRRDAIRNLSFRTKKK